MGHPGEYLASGMHGGVIYLREPLEEWQLAKGCVIEEITETDHPTLKALLDEYDAHFSRETGKVHSVSDGWYRLRPTSSRPYKSLYAH